MIIFVDMKKMIVSAALLLSLTTICFAQEIKCQWNGARVAFLGDSITDPSQIKTTNDVYWHMFEDILGITPYVYGANGHRMNQIVGQAEKLEVQHGQDVDAIIVFIGTNDYNASIPMGEWFTYSEEITEEDGHVQVARRHRELVFDPDTFKGRTNIVLKWLKTHYSTKQIIFFTPIHRGFATFGDNNIQPDENYANAHGLFINDYIQAVREIADVWAVPVIDLAAVSGLYPMLEQYDQYFRNPPVDRLHPNTAGHKRMAYTLAYQLLGYPAKLD